MIGSKTISGEAVFRNESFAKILPSCMLASDIRAEALHWAKQFRLSISSMSKPFTIRVIDLLQQRRKIKSFCKIDNG